MRRAYTLRILDKSCGNYVSSAVRLTLHTDYALRVLMDLGLREGGLASIREIAEAYGISENHLTKVVHGLGSVPN